jgi:hypothetical protein
MLGSQQPVFRPASRDHRASGRGEVGKAVDSSTVIATRAGCST